ncbi:hypothetical protein Gohar_019142 [Gossypium harknessii]|uniref:Uncharacterized protein n=2 Tax=Gossypium TaxID=3633 RepID=A0A7J9IT95_9ROSI|nr:hypothetical protein [Gossypium harknessii]MBA0825327.1 hypothetical protein [Gossypium armourianum]
MGIRNLLDLGTLALPWMTCTRHARDLKVLEWNLSKNQVTVLHSSRILMVIGSKSLI